MFEGKLTFDLAETKARIQARIRAMSDKQLSNASTRLRMAQKAAQRRADWVEREQRRREKNKGKS